MATIDEAQRWTIGDWLKIEGIAGAYPIQGWASSVGPLGGEVRPTSRRRALASECPRVIVWIGRDQDSFKVEHCRRVPPPSLAEPSIRPWSRNVDAAPF